MIASKSFSQLCICPYRFVAVIHYFSSSLSVGVSMSELSRPCRMMLLVNPQSGKGQALTLYNNHIQRMLNEAGVPHTLVITGESEAQGSRDTEGSRDA